MQSSALCLPVYFTSEYLSQFPIWATKLDETKCWKKGWLSRLSANLAFWITRTKCIQNKNGLKICQIAIQGKTLLNVYKNPGPHPLGIGDLRQCSNFEVQKRLRFESLKSEYFNFCVNRRSKSYKIFNSERLFFYRSLICTFWNCLKGTDSE